MPGPDETAVGQSFAAVRDWVRELEENSRAGRGRHRVDRDQPSPTRPQDAPPHRGAERSRCAAASTMSCPSPIRPTSRYLTHAASRSVSSHSLASLMILVLPLLSLNVSAPPSRLATPANSLRHASSFGVPSWISRGWQSVRTSGRTISASPGRVSVRRTAVTLNTYDPREEFNFIGALLLEEVERACDVPDLKRRIARSCVAPE
jgi:hypothetical protein